MPRHLLSAAMLTASLVIGAAASPAVTTTTAIAAATPAAAGPPGQSVFLVTGEHVPAGPAGAHVMTYGAGRDAGSAGPLESVSLGGATEVMPIMAGPYAGRGLSPALFEPAALARAESDGRLPVRLTYPGTLPALPGLTITSSGRGTATGYLTAAGARRFGLALARQYAADHARASYGQDGMFSGVDISLAGVRGPAPVSRPAFPMHTLTVRAVNLRGKPDTGDTITVFNVDDPARLGGLTLVIRGYFYHGTARFSVPAGHYSAIADFCCESAAEHRVVLPQFTVGGNTTVDVSERSASSKIIFATARPAVLLNMRFIVLRGAGNGDAFVFSISAGARNRDYFVQSMWVSPTTSKPTVGTIQSETTAELTSPPASRGTPYAYGLVYPGPRGTIPVQHFTASAASLATVHERYYQDVTSTGSWCALGGYVFPDGFVTLSCSFIRFRLPAEQTQYLSAGPSVIWWPSYSESESAAGGQDGGIQHLHAGQQTQDWNAYPLHPQPYVQALRGGLATRIPALPSAFRTGDNLTLSMTPFSDNYPGHAGTGYAGGPHVRVTGSYAIYQNGTRIAHGNPAGQISPVTLTARPSVIRFTLTARRRGPMFRLSTASTTTWAWHTRRQPAATVPAAWVCSYFGSRRCAVQPLMTLDYHVLRLTLDGTTRPGRQAIGLDVGHIQLGGQARITRVTAQVSFTGGRSWHPATITALGHGHFRVTFTARPGAYVTLRTRAADAAGGSITETILRAYQVAPRAARGA